MSDTVSIPELIAGLSRPWQPVEFVQANDAVVRLARFEGEFPLHDLDAAFSAAPECANVSASPSA